ANGGGERDQSPTQDGPSRDRSAPGARAGGSRQRYGSHRGRGAGQTGRRDVLGRPPSRRLPRPGESAAGGRDRGVSRAERDGDRCSSRSGSTPPAPPRPEPAEYRCASCRSRPRGVCVGAGGGVRRLAVPDCRRRGADVRGSRPRPPRGRRAQRREGAAGFGPRGRGHSNDGRCADGTCWQRVQVLFGPRVRDRLRKRCLPHLFQRRCRRRSGPAESEGVNMGSTSTEDASRVRVIIVDDEPLIRSGIRAILGADPNIEVLAEAGDGREAVDAVAGLRPEVLLLDTRMPRLDGLAAIPEILNVRPEANVVMLTTFGEDAYIAEALEKGAVGFLLKASDPRELQDAVHAAASGAAYLSPRVAHRVIDRF